MQPNKLDHVFDKLVQKTILGFIPKWMTPNQFTYIRIATIPFIYFLLNYGLIFWAIVLFALSALTDLIDGALARSRNLVTTTGKVMDPIADKLLIVTVLAYVGFDKPLIKYFSIFIVLEIVAVLGGVVLAKHIGKPIGVNIFGKIKMCFQAFGVTFFLVGTFLKVTILTTISLWLLAAAFLFAVVAGVVQFKHRFFSIKAHRKSLKK